MTGLMAAFGAGCGRAGFLAANLPASFGAYRRHSDMAYGDHPLQRLDVYVPDDSAADRGSAPGRTPARADGRRSTPA